MSHLASQTGSFDAFVLFVCVVVVVYLGGFLGCRLQTSAPCFGHQMCKLVIVLASRIAMSRTCDCVVAGVGVFHDVPQLRVSPRLTSLRVVKP